MGTVGTVGYHEPPLPQSSAKVGIVVPSIRYKHGSLGIAIILRRSPHSMAYLTSAMVSESSQPKLFIWLFATVSVREHFTNALFLEPNAGVAL